tara:strand:- start:514 stop:657 length:144 start_codon:yes stop_codon:yes gene_type:complete
MEEAIKLIDKKIEEILMYDIDTQENEERYIQELQCLEYAKFLLTEQS